MKTIKLCLIGLLAFFTSCAFAEGVAGKNGYLTDRYGDIVRDNYGVCWHSGSWTPALALPECEGSAMKKASVRKDVNTHRGASNSSASPYE